MRTKFTYLLTISSLLILGSCATSNQTAQQADQNDDVYYSEATAKEKAEVIAQAKPEASRQSDYVTDEELYRDAYGNTGDYAQRIYRFRNYTPWRGYYSNIYGYGNSYGYGNIYSSYYDPFYSPYNFYGGPGINLAIGINGGFYNYNPWRMYGYNYTGNFWGPYSYYNPYGIGFGGGYFGNNGYYGGGYGVGRPAYTSPNYRPRPTRGSDGLSIDPGAVNGGNPGGIIRNGNNGNVIQPDRSRAGRYNGGNSTTTPPSGNTRPQATAPRPERVSQQPQRTSQPDRVNSAPPQNNNSGGGRSNDSGGSSGARPSRGN